MTIIQKSKKISLVASQFFKALYFGLSPFFFIPGLLNKYPKVAKKIPMVSSFFMKRFSRKIPKHFKNIYTEKLLDREMGEIYDVFLSFFLLRDYVPNIGWTIIDIGAFKGFYSFSCADLIGQEGLVVAVEPNQIQYLGLKKISEKEKIKNILFLNCAISSKNEVLKLNISESFPSTSSVSSEHTSRFDQNFKSILVEGITLDKLIERENLKKLDLVKIDVEGAELDVLLGAEHTLKNKKVTRFIIEVHQDVVNIKQVKEILKKNKYKIDAIIKTSGERSFVYSQLG